MNNETIRLDTFRLLIRDPELKDLPEWHRLISNEKNMYYLQEIMTNTLEESKDNLLLAISEIQNQHRTKYFFAIELKETGKFVGSIGYTVISSTPMGKIVDADGIDVWLGSVGTKVDAIICTVDLMKRDSEIKILIGCSEGEKQLVLAFHNNSEYMKGVLLHREDYF